MTLVGVETTAARQVRPQPSKSSASELKANDGVVCELAHGLGSLHAARAEQIEAIELMRLQFL